MDTSSTTKTRSKQEILNCLGGRMSLFASCLRNEELSGIKAGCSKVKGSNPTLLSGLLRGSRCRKLTSLAYFACLAAALGMISWRTSGFPSLSIERLGGSVRLTREVPPRTVSLQRYDDSVHGQENFEVQTPFIQDVVTHPDELLLLLRLPGKPELPAREWLYCRFGNNTYTEVNGVDQYKARVVVRCPHPLTGSTWSVEELSLVEEKDLVFSRPRVAYREPLKWSRLVYEFWSDEEGVVLFVKGIMRKRRDFADLSRLRCVYDGGLEVPVTVAAQEIFRCSHPPMEARQRHVNRKVTLKLDALMLPSVVYYEPTFRVRRKRDGVPLITGNDVVKTSHSTKTRIDTRGRDGVVGRGAKKLVAPRSQEERHLRPDAAFERKGRLLCSCNLIWNGAKFLREWIMYHSVLGVEKFFLYDNNSDDDIKDVVRKLVHQGYDIKIIVWPWVKSQEAGFSHCALLAASECTWLLYADVDEFVFPVMWINASLRGAESSFPEKTDFFLKAAGDKLRTDISGEVGEDKNRDHGQHFALEVNLNTRGSGDRVGVHSFQKSSAELIRSQAPLVALILDMSETVEGEKKVGQISIICRDFGPSGLAQHPKEGVTVGYTCRLATEERHKSIVLLAAVDKSLKNYIHHFTLGYDYYSLRVPSRNAVVNHYKYQAWDEFKTKFKRRVSTYVADWTETKKLNSKDRAPGLGSSAVKPVGWEKQFCEVQDFRLRSYALRIFWNKDKATMIWS